MILPNSDIEEAVAVQLFESVLNKGTIREQQAALTALGSLKGQEAVKALETALDKMTADQIPLEVQLDLVEAVEAQNNEGLNQKLKAYQECKFR